MKTDKLVVNFKSRKTVDGIKVPVDEKYFVLLEKHLKKLIKEARLAVKGMPHSLDMGVCFLVSRNEIKTNIVPTLEVLEFMVVRPAREHIYCRNLTGSLAYPFGELFRPLWTNKVEHGNILSPAEKRLALLNLMLRICKRLIDLTMEAPLEVVHEPEGGSYISYNGKPYTSLMGFTNDVLFGIIEREKIRRRKYKEKLLEVKASN